MATQTLATRLGPATLLPKGAKSAALVDVLTLDPLLVGKAFQSSSVAVVDTTDAVDDLTAIALAFPLAQVFASMELRRPTIEQVLIDAGLRIKLGDGSLTLTAHALAVDAGTEAR